MAKIDVGQALLDPSSIFRTPQDVLDAEGLSRTVKIKILRRWEYDARELEVAEEENMPATGGANSLLDDILKALLTLDAGHRTENTPPTKQGGE